MKQSNKPTTAERVTQEILDLLDKGVCPWKRGWDGGPPMSIHGRRYRGINLWLLSYSPYSSNRWLTVHMANELGGNIKKGEKGRLVILWKRTSYLKENEEGEEEVRNGLLLRGYHVFNAEQTEGIPPEKLHITPHEHDPIPEANAIWEGYEDGPSLEYGGGTAYYMPSTDTIRLPDPSAFHSPEAFYQALFHESAHSTGVKERLNRPNFDKRDFDSYGEEELVAEMTSAMLCAECGIKATMANSAAYCKAWADNIRKNPAKMVIQVAARAQRAFDYILGHREEPSFEE